MCLNPPWLLVREIRLSETHLQPQPRFPKPLPSVLFQKKDQSLDPAPPANTHVWFDTGIVSLTSLAVLSYERYCTMTGATEADTTNYRKTRIGIVLSWTYSLIWTTPPLFGWSSYGPEGPGPTCSVSWHSKDTNNVSYIICLFIFCLVVPFGIIVYSYGRILCAVRQVSKFLSCLFTVTPNQAKPSDHRFLPLSPLCCHS